jgi:hypothetical protein
LGVVVQRACQEAVLSRDGIGGAAFPNWLWLFRGTCANQNKMLEPARRGEESTFLPA